MWATPSHSTPEVFQVLPKREHNTHHLSAWSGKQNTEGLSQLPLAPFGAKSEPFQEQECPDDIGVCDMMAS